jgi:hypothetical protein
MSTLGTMLIVLTWAIFSERKKPYKNISFLKCVSLNQSMPTTAKKVKLLQFNFGFKCNLKKIKFTFYCCDLFWVPPQITTPTTC